MTTANPSGSEVSASVRRRPLSERIESSIGALLFVNIALVALLSLAFLSHGNRTATKGYEIKTLREARSNLLRENEVFSMQIADLQSLSAMANDQIIRAMVKIEKPKYIRGDTAVAKN